MALRISIASKHVPSESEAGPSRAQDVANRAPSSKHLGIASRRCLRDIASISSRSCFLCETSTLVMLRLMCMAGTI
jgi:glycerol-3-phosphate dehydrogenase